MSQKPRATPGHHCHVQMFGTTLLLLLPVLHLQPSVHPGLFFFCHVFMLIDLALLCWLKCLCSRGVIETEPDATFILSTVFLFNFAKPLKGKPIFTQ